MVLNRTYLMMMELLGGLKRFFMNHEGILFLLLLVGIPVASILIIFMIVFAIMYPISLLIGLL
ncbi:hypothetical protein [Anaerorhabdus furcosa]|uniref:Uncharacterized protein n=1 Tax=Anaerorhabdus furcosa TaxID=118967 RepID=A0A1T4LGA4_9FIRM|nr:hypothetical protein [Anaerorhabdus furcosa]SJZ53755.1 hypothetical protein SAMN02745191_0875 [Anaerorhabdus furcosa]